MTGRNPNGRELTRRLVAQAEARSDATDSADAAVAACENAFRTLSRWVGASGTHALFARALSQVQSDPLVLRGISLRRRPEVGFDGIAESVEARGAAAVAADLESLLVALFELISRLIGEDMVARLVDHAALNHAPESRSPR